MTDSPRYVKIDFDTYAEREAYIKLVLVEGYNRILAYVKDGKYVVELCKDYDCGDLTNS
jgi:hypothetical protein